MANETRNSFLIRMNDKIKDLKLNMAELIRQRKESQDENSSSIVVNSPRSPNCSELSQQFNNQINSAMPKRMSGFKDFMSEPDQDDHIIEIANGEQNKGLEDYLQKSMHQSSPRTFDQSAVRRTASDGENKIRYIQTDNYKHSTSMAHNKINQNDNNPYRFSFDLPIQKCNTSQMGFQADISSDRDDIKKQRQASYDQSAVTQYDAFIQRDKMNQSGKLSSKSGMRESGYMKNYGQEMNKTKYVNPLLQVHYEYMQSQKNAVPYQVLHSKSLQIQQNVQNLYCSSTKKRAIIVQEQSLTQSPLPLKLPMTKLHPINLDNDCSSSLPMTQSQSSDRFSSSTYSQKMYQNFKDTQNQQGSFSQSTVMLKKQQSNLGQLNLTDREFKQKSVPSRIDVSKLPLKYKLNQIIQSKDHKVVQGKLRQYNPKSLVQDNLCSSGIKLKGQNAGYAFQEYMPSS